MADVDISSYPKPVAGKSLFDQVKDLGAIQQQKQSLQSGALTIEKQKLDLLANRMDQFSKGLLTLGQDPTLDFNKIDDFAKNQLKLGYLTPDVYARSMSTLPQNATPQEYQARVKQFAMQALQTHDAIQQMYGQNQDVDQGNQTSVGVRQSPMMGGQFKQTGTFYQQQPPNTQNVDNRETLPNGQPNPNYLQPGYVGAAGPPGVQPPPSPVPQARTFNQPFFQGDGRVALPQRNLSGMTTAPTSETRERVDLEGTEPAKNFNDRFGSSFPNRVVTGAAPGVASAIENVGAQSGKDYATALTRARNYQADLYPAQAALHSIKELGPQAIGPGTDAFNDVKRALVTWLPNVDPKTIDNVSNFDQIKKYLTQVARTSGNTGTNDQLAAAFDANPNTKMSTAGVETVLKSIIALRKMEQAQTILFNQQGYQPNQYSQWVAKNQNVFDPRAFGFIDMDRKAQDKLIKSLTPNERKKFEDTLIFAEKAKLIEPPQVK